jgi:prepilin-type N-terminal cleavage/methylation domain-containing protein
MSLKGHNSGFTLIELLVVIAIVGLLSSVVLASLTSARNKSADTSIRQNMSQVARSAALYYDTNGSYGTGEFNEASGQAGTCSNDTDNFLSVAAIRDQLAAAGNASNGGGLGRATCRITVGATGGYAISIPLKTNSALHWCIDSTGVSKIRSAVISGAGVSC